MELSQLAQGSVQNKYFADDVKEASQNKEVKISSRLGSKPKTSNGRQSYG